MRKRDEPVRLTRIYTRGGDQGETSLGDGAQLGHSSALHAGQAVPAEGLRMSVYTPGDAETRHREYMVRQTQEPAHLLGAEEGTNRSCRPA